MTEKLQSQFSCKWNNKNSQKDKLYDKGLVRDISVTIVAEKCIYDARIDRKDASKNILWDYF